MRNGVDNSTATVAELSVWLRDPAPDAERAGISLNFVTVAAMFVRNLALLAIFSPAAAAIAILPIAVMSGARLHWCGLTELPRLRSTICNYRRRSLSAKCFRSAAYSC